MAFSAGRQLFSSAPCNLDLQDTSQSYENVPCIFRYSRVFRSMHKQPPVKKAIHRPSKASSSPSLSSSTPSSTSLSTPSTSSKALKESLVASALSVYEEAYALRERDSEIHATTHSWSDIERLLVELRRSLLETQWALTNDQRQENPCTETENKNMVVRSGQPSARQRRLRSRKQPGTNSSENCVVSRSSCTSNDKKTEIAEALQVVSTIRLKGKRDLLTKEEEVLLSKKMKVGSNLRSAKAKLTKSLGHEPSDDLWASSVNLTYAQVQAKLLEADRARDQMFISNLRLVFSVANKYTGLGVGLPDLVQEGALGLLRGLDKFNHKKGFKLSTYVHWWIRQGITRALADHSRTVRLPAHMHERLKSINKAAASLRMDGAANLSQAVNLPREMVVGALKSTKKMVSLDNVKRWGQFGSEEESLHNYIADPRPESDPWTAVDNLSLREDVDYLLRKILNKREREIVRLHYGLDHVDGQGLSLEKISHRYGISRERIRQVEGCALRKLAATGQRMVLNIPLSNI
ncbi:hypothetical protein KP509_12G082200 [Ceratopteris richardii]|uniref:RNA polymerase sigma-70 domain-containing protein n=1 Tax=Ceratopteris richardii TaxID=49495 RepID=A0A8T2TQ92_CERRI|nr:hypothetical protein KP509_12G082200 [Ceratopteris richardii]